MRSIKKLLWILPILAMLIAMVPFAVVADDTAVKNGWVVEDGIQRYYADGAYLTGVHKIDKCSVKFADNGAYVGIEEVHDQAGELDTNEGEAYLSAMTALKASGSKIYYYHDLNNVALGTCPSNITAGTLSVGGSLLCVQRKVKFEIVERGNGRAILVKGPEALVDPNVTGDSNHCYIDATFSNHKEGEEVVIEMDMKLGADYNYNSTIQLLDRNNKDTGASYFIGVMKLNKDGSLYTSVGVSKKIATITKDEYTRVSFVIHPSANTMDFYVNGAFVTRSDFITDTTYKAENFQIDALRTAQFSGALELGSIYVDNFAAYQASAPVCVTSFPGNTAKVVVGGNSTTEIVPSNMFMVPDAATIDNGVFAYWKIIDGDKTSTAYPGDMYIMNGDISCIAVEMDYELLEGASIRTGTTEYSALRFMAKLERSAYDALTAIGAKAETRMLIVPTEFFEDTYGYYTIEALNKSGYEGKYADVEAENWYAANDNYYYYVASLDNIPTVDYAKEYSAIAYLRVTYPNGEVSTVYAPFKEAEHTRTVYQIAHAAYNDRTTLKDQANYGNNIVFNGNDTYSPYTSEKLRVIGVAADKVINLYASGKDVVPAGRFYMAPYTVVTSFNSATGKNDVAISSSGGDWSLTNAVGVVYDGRKLAEDEYDMGDGIFCSLSVEAISYDLNALYSAPKDMKSWLLLDPFYSERNRFSGYVNAESDPEHVRPETDVEVSGSFVWDYDTATITFNPSSDKLGSRMEGAIEGAYVGIDSGSYYYYNLGDIEAISFWAWSDVNNQTFQLNLYSDDPESEGEDYYGMKFRMNAGWNRFIVSKKDFSANRSPMGWEFITKIAMTNTGWSQSPDKNNNVYLSEFRAYDSNKIATPFADQRLDSAAVFANNGFYCGVDGGLVKISDGDDTALAFMKDDVFYIPMAAVAAVRGEGGVYYPVEGVLTFRYNDADYVFTAGSKYYTVNGEKKELSAAPVMNGRALFFADSDVMSVFGYTQKYVDRMGFIALSNTENLFDAKADFETIYDLIESMIYVRPTGDKIVEDLNSYSGGQHPYLMIDAKGFDRLRYYADMDATLQGYIKTLEANYGIGTAKFESAVRRYDLPDGQRLLSISRDVMNKTISWAILAKIYEKSDPARFEQYAERIWLELEAAANYKDPDGYYSWHPAHFLDTGELGYPFGICYDWLYDYWAKTGSNVNVKKAGQQEEDYKYSGGVTRLSILEDAMFWMGLSATSALPSDTTGKYISYNYNLAGSTNNWNGVCNGGLMASALAIANVDRYAESIKTYLSSTILGVESGMWVYAPEGGYEEGPGYWSYGTTYLQVFMSCLNSACGTNYGLYNTPGFAHSVYFSTYLGSKNTTWGFHDGRSGSADTNIAAWFAKESNDPNVNAIRREAIANGWKGVSMYDVMWFDPHIMTSTITLELDSYYSLDAIATFRSGWDTTNNIFVGIHGGDNTASHGDLDIGNFVINVNGSFIINDLGSDEYNMPGYFGNYRWSYYRKRAEGQNTLVMIKSKDNKDDKGWVGKAGKPALSKNEGNTAANTNLPTLDQVGNAISKMLRYETGTNSALGVVEMHPAYEEMTEGVRGMLFTDNRSTIVIQDEAVMSEDMDIWWFAHTQGTITVSADGRYAIIKRGAVYLYAEIVTDMPEKATFVAMDAKSLDSEYVLWDGRNPLYTGDIEKGGTGLQKLTIRVDDCANLRLAVVFKVIDNLNDIPELGTTYQWTDIADWKVD